MTNGNTLCKPGSKLCAQLALFFSLAPTEGNPAWTAFAGVTELVELVLFECPGQQCAYAGIQISIGEVKKEEGLGPCLHGVFRLVIRREDESSDADHLIT